MGMKWIIVMLLFSGCVGSIDKVEGIYVGHFEHEYGINDDTLILNKENDAENIYNITRRTGTIRKKDGKLFPKENKVEFWITEYNEEAKLFKELRRGKIITWNSKGETLKMGNTLYQKMKQ
jgi:hypothetical protein